MPDLARAAPPERYLRLADLARLCRMSRWNAARSTAHPALSGCAAASVPTTGRSLRSPWDGHRSFLLRAVLWLAASPTSLAGCHGETSWPPWAGRWCGSLPSRRVGSFAARRPDAGRPCRPDASSSLRGRTVLMTTAMSVRLLRGAGTRRWRTWPGLLRDQQARNIDVVTPAAAVHAAGNR
jgi:hypothetical protein